MEKLFQLRPPEQQDLVGALEQLGGPADYADAANNGELVEHLEGVVSVWTNQISQDGNITVVANEAKNNVRFLYTLDRFFGPLGKCTPTSVLDHIPSLMASIRMIHTVSQFYNTPERMTSLFVKVTNQMISTCRAYLRQGVAKVWEHSRPELLQRISECCHLNTSYQKSFHAVRDKLRENPEERQFDFSENYIFGKFDTFCRRLEKLADMASTLESLSALRNMKTERMLEVLAVFEAGGVGARVDLKERYLEVVQRYSRDLDLVSGRVMWCRQLYRKMESPMLVLREKLDLLKEVFVNLDPKVLEVLQEFWYLTKTGPVIENVYVALRDLDQVAKVAMDTLGCRVERLLWDMGSCRLLELPVDTPSQQVEKYVFELMEELKRKDEASYQCLHPDVKQQTRCQECLPCRFYNLLGHVCQRNTDALLRATKSSLEAFRKRLHVTSSYPTSSSTCSWSSRDRAGPPPLFRASIQLTIPNIVLRPSLEDIQDPEEQVKSFLETDPSLTEFSSQISHYSKLEAQIEELPASFTVGPVLLDTEQLKLSLTQECRVWKRAFGGALTRQASARMDEVFAFVESLTKRLQRPVGDLEDVREAMSALREVPDAAACRRLVRLFDEGEHLVHPARTPGGDGSAERVDGLSYAWKNLNALVPNHPPPRLSCGGR
ncbi:hypothetical protein CRUP_015692 [Coryphaenoides rupestris]|nr:hypothetical protein CRUP_015692 [Coryphaenoides rupestris]